MVLAWEPTSWISNFYPFAPNALFFYGERESVHWEWMSLIYFTKSDF